MASLTSGSVVRQIGSLFEGSSVAGMSDQELLDRFTARRDSAGETAFAALVLRHGPMVLCVCNELLGDRHHAEDAVQAVFLILAQKAHSIRDPDLLGNWLYGVALRTARYARRSRQRNNERTTSMLDAIPGVAAPSAEQSLLSREQAELLHEEIERLPRTFRLPVVLCYLEGLTVHEAARRLRWSHGTLRSRMARAREKLRRALTRRGVVVPAATLAAALSTRSAAASVSSHLCETTACAAISFAAGQSASPLAVAVARQLVRSALLEKVKLLAMSLLLLGAIATSAAYLTRALARNDEPKPPQPGVRSGQASRQPAAAPSPDPDRVTIHGRVLAPDGKPLPGARVAVVAMPPPLPQGRLVREPEHYEVLASATADADGRFRIDFPRIATDRNGLNLVVGATGWALTGKYIGDDLPASPLTITMEPERSVRGRLFDVQGQPIAGVRVRVSQYHTAPFDGASQAPAWPEPATTDQEGRFTFRGLGRSSTIMIEASSDRHARQTFRIDFADEPKSGALSLTLSPAQVIEVRTTRADDGKPLPGVWVSVRGVRRQRPSTERANGAATDDQGRARIIPASGESFSITAYPPAGEPYLDARADLVWPKGAVTQSIELKFSRGVSVPGTITEAASGKPVPGALVNYSQTTINNPLLRRGELRHSETVSDPEGKFQIVVPAGPGHLLVRAATPDYLHITTTNAELGVRSLPNALMYPDALAHIDIKPGAAPENVKLQLRRGVVVAGRVLGPDGHPITSAIALGRTYLHFKVTGTPFTFFTGNAPQIKVRDGRFEIPGCDPEKPFTFHFLDREHQLGATVELSGKSAQNGPVTIRLEKCGAANVRYKDPQGKPVAGNTGDQLMLIITPGADINARPDQIMADMQYQSNLDSERLRRSRTDADGRITWSSLIPGAKYRLRGHDFDFTAEAGKTIDLPDVTIPRP
jgi:RNA polymerase sigma factor (sigma-70 family)